MVVQTPLHRTPLQPTRRVLRQSRKLVKKQEAARSVREIAVRQAEQPQIMEAMGRRSGGVVVLVAKPVLSLRARRARCISAPVLIQADLLAVQTMFSRPLCRSLGSRILPRVCPKVNIITQRVNHILGRDPRFPLEFGRIRIKSAAVLWKIHMRSCTISCTLRPQL